MHIRLFGPKESPTKQDQKADAYKSNNRDWQRGLRQNANQTTTSDGLVNENPAAHKGDFAKKLWLELKSTNEGPRNDDYQYQTNPKNAFGLRGSNYHENKLESRGSSRQSNVQRIIKQNQSIRNAQKRSQSVQRTSSRKAINGLTANTRSQQHLNNKENDASEKTYEVGDYMDMSKSKQDDIGYHGREKRMNRAKEYLDQVINAQTSRSKSRVNDNKSLITHQDLVDMQDRIEARSQSRIENENCATPFLPARSHRTKLLTRENLRKLESKADYQWTSGDDLSYLSDQTVDVQKLLTELNLPSNLFQQMNQMPEELWAYIIDEIIYEVQLPKFATAEKQIVENYKSKQDKILSEAQVKRKNAAILNLETIKNNQLSQMQERKRNLERDKRLNQLYPKNMKDETRSATHERKVEQRKQQEQFQMLQEQESNVLYPKN